LLSKANYVTETVNWRQRDKETKKESEKHHSLSIHTDVRRSISTEIGTVVEKFRAIISLPNLFGPTNNLAATVIEHLA